MKKLFTTLFFLVTFQYSNAQICFSPKTSFQAGVNPSSICHADFNNDNFIDLAVANINTGGSNVSILLGDGSGNFSNDSSYDVGPLPHSICTADFNRDGNADLATANSGPGTVSILLGNGAGNFTADSGFTTGIYTQSTICTADFNGDNIADIVVSTGFNYLLLFIGNGTGGFSAGANVAGVNSTDFVISEDFNDDGKADLATTTYNGSHSISILIGNGIGGFAPPINNTLGVQIRSITCGDFNGDGRIDLASANIVTSILGNVSILINTGGGNFATATNFGIGDSTLPHSIINGDFDSDSIIDLALACVSNNNNGKVSILKGNGAGGFGVAVKFAVDTFPNSVICSDFNSDGKADLALSATKSNIETGKVSVLLNCNTIGIDEPIDLSDQFNIYPNPTSGKINISSSINFDEIKITDMIGQIIYQSKSYRNNLVLEIVKTGIYFITFTSNNQSAVKKIIVSN